MALFVFRVYRFRIKMRSNSNPSIPLSSTVAYVDEFSFAFVVFSVELAFDKQLR